MTAAPPVGTIVDGRFEVTGVLGEGGMGVVLRARHRFTGAEVALKLLHRHLRLRGDTASRMLAEARAATAIRHPGVVTVIDAGLTSEGDPYLVMELLSGETLGSMMRSRVFDVAVMRHIGAGILDVLAAAHAAGCVHRDLKPENVFLLRPSGTIKLLDFGIAKGLAQEGRKETASGMVMGTPTYMSPEQLMSSKNVDHRTDLWAVGVVLYEMATGAVPFAAQGMGGMLLRVLGGPPAPLLDHLVDPHPWLDGFFKRALAADAAARFASAAEMARALSALPDAPLLRRRATDRVGHETTEPRAPTASRATGQATQHEVLGLARSPEASPTDRPPMPTAGAGVDPRVSAAPVGALAAPPPAPVGTPRAHMPTALVAAASLALSASALTGWAVVVGKRTPAVPVASASATAMLPPVATAGPTAAAVAALDRTEPPSASNPRQKPRRPSPAPGPSTSAGATGSEPHAAHPPQGTGEPSDELPDSRY